MAENDARRVVERVYAGWTASDIEATLAPLAEDVRYTLHAGPGEELPFAGTALGKDQVRQRLQLILDHFEIEAYVVESMRVHGDEVRASIVFYYRHVDTGDPLNGRFRHVWKVSGDVVVSCDEYHDAALLHAFLRMVDWRRRQADDEDGGAHRGS